VLPALDMDGEKILAEWNKVTLDAAALALIERSQKSREYLHRAAKIPNCDWSLDHQDGITLLVPHGPKALSLARLTALHARHEFELGHWDAGWDDVTAIMKLARHVELEPLMLLQLMGYRIETMALEAAAPYLPELKASIKKSGTAALDRPPAVPTLEQMVVMEKQLGPQWLLGRLKDAEQRQPGSWQKIWDETFAWAKGTDQDLVKTAKSYQNAVALLEGGIPLYDELAKLSALPPNDFDAKYPVFAAKVKKAGPFAGLLLPNMNNIVAFERRSRAQVALFKAAIDVVDGGPAKLKGSNDPFGDGPFEYQALDRGFELKSKLVVRGQPVTLVVGNAKKN
jgi:hypothetical protein